MNHSRSLLLEAFSLAEQLAELPEEEREQACARLCAGRPELHEALLHLAAEPAEVDEQLPLRPLLEEWISLSDEDPVPGTCLGPYQMGALLGVGGMGRVYRAVHIGHGGLAAVKLLHARYGASEEAMSRLRREAHMLARCRHMGIVQIYHLDTSPSGESYFAMELVEGLPITDYCAERKLGLRDRIALLVKVCEAVTAAHDVGVIHRDLKPTNVLANASGVKLLDFGVAEAFGDADMSCRGFLSGLYAAPEQLEETTKRTDVFSLGVLLGELLVNRLPFQAEGDTMEEQRASRFAAPRVPLSGFAAPHTPLHDASPLLRAELDAVFSRATDPDAATRYSSVAAFAEELRRLQAGHAVEALRANRPMWRLPYTGWRALRRHALAAGVVVSCLGLGTAALASYTYGLRTERDAARQAEHEADQQRRQQAMLASILINDDGAMNLAMSRTLLDRAVRKAELIDLDPDQRAGLLKNIGSDFVLIGELDRAQQLFAEALTLVSKRYGPKSDGAVEIQLLQADVLETRGDYAQALQLAQQAKAALLERLSPSDSRVLRADIAIAEVLTAEAKYTEAKPILENVVAREAGQPALSADYGVALNDLGIAENYLGHLDRSLALTQQSMAIDIASKGSRHPDIGEDLLSISNLYVLLGDPAKAITAGRQALSILTAALSPGSHDVFAAQRQLAMSLEAAGDSREAESLYRSALAGLAQEKRHSQTEVVATLGLGDTLRRQGKLAESLAAYQHALALLRQLFAAPNALWASAYYDVSATETLMHRQHDAELSAREALRLARKLLGEDSEKSEQSRILLAYVLLAEHRPAEAEQLVVDTRRLADRSNGTMRRVLSDADDIEHTIQSKAAPQQVAQSSQLRLPRTGANR